MFTEETPEAAHRRAHFMTGLTVLTAAYALTLVAIKHLFF